MSLTTMNLTAEHFARIRSFLDARLNPLFDATAGSTHAFATDDTSRALRALLSTVGYQAAMGNQLKDHETLGPNMQQITRDSAYAAWHVLSSIAREWKDHPDYLPEFAKEPYGLPPGTGEWP
ncbi:hypothetical protein [Streptomyces sp. DSM 41534]